jgi:hypothetical protein
MIDDWDAYVQNVIAHKQWVFLLKTWDL